MCQHMCEARYSELRFKLNNCSQNLYNTKNHPLINSIGCKNGISQKIPNKDKKK